MCISLEMKLKQTHENESRVQRFGRWPTLAIMFSVASTSNIVRSFSLVVLEALVVLEGLSVSEGLVVLECVVVFKCIVVFKGLVGLEDLGVDALPHLA